MGYKRGANKMFTIDLDYYDLEDKKLIGDMCFYFETTLSEDIWRNSAEEMQSVFTEGFNSGYIGEDLENPEIHIVTGINDEGEMGDAVICNIVMLQNHRELESEIRNVVSERFPNAEIKVWYK